MRIGVIAKPHRTEFAAKLKETVQWLSARGCEVVVEEDVVRKFGLKGTAAASREDIPQQVDTVVVFGGDGTILSVARLIRHSKTPILGVNLGSLGFLAEVTLDEIFPALEKLLAGKYELESRSLLRTEVHPAGGQTRTYHALNDAVINKGALARIFSIDAFINDDFIANFLTDGMIVSTPTGSTAYSLAAGGPIVLPTLDSILLTPICPHTLTNRPIVIPARSQVRMILKSGEEVMLTMDGQIGLALQQGDEIVCTRSEYEIELIRPGRKSFFGVLREKLKWGER